MIDRSRIGFRTVPTRTAVDAWRVKLFCQAIGEKAAVYIAFEHFAPVYVGDIVEVSRNLVDIYDKQGGALTFIVVDTDYRVGGRPVATSRQTTLVRNTVEAA